MVMHTAEKHIQNILNSKKISSKNRKELHELDIKLIADGRAMYTRKNRFDTLYKFTLFLNKDFDKVNKKDITSFCAYLEKTLNKGSPKGHKINVKWFYRWYYKEYMNWNPRFKNDTPDIVSDIEIKNNNGLHKIPEELLTPEDIKLLVNNTPSLRNKALIMVMYDGALRISECLGLKLKHCIFDEYGGSITVDGKTGRRKLRLFDSIPYLKNYIETEHPNKNNPNETLFVGVASKGVKKNDYGTPLRDGGVRILFKRIADRAKLKKNFYPHILRHSRLTELAKILSEQELKVFAGWTASSNMAQVYIHLSGKDVEDKLLKHHGLIKEDSNKKEEPLKPKKCIDPSCDYMNAATNKFCSRCHRPIEIKEIMKIEDEQQLFNKVKEKAILEKLDINAILEKIVEAKMKNR